MSYAVDRVRSLMGRLLSSVESVFKCDLDDVRSNDEFRINGDEVTLIRNLILDACNDTIRSLPKKDLDGKLLNIPREMFPIFKDAELEVLDSGIPRLILTGDARFIYEIRDKIGRGIVYNENGVYFYVSLGVDDIVNFIIPFLDKVRLSRIVIGNGKYEDWRRQVVKIYLDYSGEDNG